MKSMLIAGLTAGLSSLFATAALAACPGAGCAYAPASPHYTFGPLPAYAATPAYAPPQYAPQGNGPPQSHGWPPAYAPQPSYGPPAYAPPQLPPPPYLRGDEERGDYGR